MTNFDKRKCEMIIKDIEENKYGPWYNSRELDNYYNLDVSYLIEIVTIEEYMYKTTSWFNPLKKLNHRDAMKYIYRILDTKSLSEKLNGIYNHFIYKNKAQVLSKDALEDIIHIDDNSITLFASIDDESAIAINYIADSNIVSTTINGEDDYELDLNQDSNNIDTVLLHIIEIIVEEVLQKYINLMIKYKKKYNL